MCVAVDDLGRSRLVQIRETHELVKEQLTELAKFFPALGDDAQAKLYYADVGYLLGLLAEHPADEPPEDERSVLVYLECGDCCVGWYEHGQAVWYAEGSQVFDAVCWRELPSEPKVNDEQVDTER
jgi:hypothetical protein